jgi:hypothetical protein
MWDGEDDEHLDLKVEEQFDIERKQRKVIRQMKQDVRARTIKSMYRQLLAPYTVGDAMGIAGERISKDMDILYEIA